MTSGARAADVSRRTVLTGLGAAALWPMSGARADVVAAPVQIIGRDRHHIVKPDDTLHDLARHYGLGFVELRAANQGVDAFRPEPEQVLVIPGAHILPDPPHQGIIVNRADMRLYYFVPQTPLILSWPVGIGREDWETPIRSFRVTQKREAPTWRPPKSIRDENPDLPAEVPPGPDNPLGDYALRIGWDGYAIHGTNAPDGVGRRVSHGCVRLYPENIEFLFGLIELGEQVRIIDEPLKLAWSDRELFLEAHPSPAQGAELEISGRLSAVSTPSDWEARINDAAGKWADRVDWTAAYRAMNERRGVPIKISL